MGDVLTVNLRIRRDVLLLSALAAGLAAIWLYWFGDWGPMCLGPLAYSHTRCIAGDMSDNPGWSPAPGPATPWVAALACALLVAGVRPWSIRRVQLAAMAIVAAVGAVLGAAANELPRQPRLVDQGGTGVPPDHVEFWVVNVALPSNPDTRLLVMVLVAADGRSAAERAHAHEPYTPERRRSPGVTSKTADREVGGFESHPLRQEPRADLLTIDLGWMP